MFAHHHPHSHYLSILGKLSLLGPICTNWRKLSREVFPDGMSVSGVFDEAKDLEFLCYDV